MSNSKINPTILNVLISMENNGKSKRVINSTRKELNNLAKNADLTKPEEAKALIARMKTGNAYKRMLVQAYNRYTKYCKINWEAPRYKVTRREISVPTDEKIKMLISASKKPLSTKFQLSYETGLGPVESCELKVKDFNKENKKSQQKQPKGTKRQPRIILLTYYRFPLCISYLFLSLEDYVLFLKYNVERT
ncbi:MAG: hypothetical protein ABSD92_04260 [Candidatus Bathyarchaeia archaeon]